MKINFGRPDSVSTIADAVLRYGDKEFESPTRSTIPLLSLLQHGLPLFSEITSKLGIPDEPHLFLEYTVSSPKGKGKASHTDVMLKSGAYALAIEAKWTEPMYDEVRKWKKKGSNESNKQNVLEGWLSLLGKHLKTTFDASNFEKSIYQMLHRAASAAGTGTKPRLAYFIFKPSPGQKTASSEDIQAKLEQLWVNLGRPVTLTFSVVEIETKPTKAYEAIGNLPKGKPTTAEAVIAALVAEAPLFSFANYEIKTIGE
jgi:hypothetical protein